MNTRPIVLRMVAVILLVASVGNADGPVPAVPSKQGGEFGVTFFGWSDQHVKTNGDVSHLLEAIDAMNGLPGTAYPRAVAVKLLSPPSFLVVVM